MVPPKGHQLVTFCPFNGEQTNTAGSEKSTRSEADGKDATPRKPLRSEEQVLEGDQGQSDGVLTLSAEEDLLKSPVSAQNKMSKALSRYQTQKPRK